MKDDEARDGTAVPTRLVLTPRSAVLLGLAVSRHRCRRCGAAPEASIVGPSVSEFCLDLQSGAQGTRPVIRLRTECLRCGATNRKRIGGMAPRELWERFVTALASMRLPIDEGDGRWADRAAAGGSGPAARVEPSRRNPNAGPITADEAIGAILELRGIGSAEELLEWLGVPRNDR